MLTNILLERPLAVLDLETTGLNPEEDRIVEIGILKIYPTHNYDQINHRINPGIAIPKEATAVHSISDGDVADAPFFADLTETLLLYLGESDLCGFNLKRFDLPVLLAEFRRAGRPLSLEGRALLDPMEMFHHHEPRDLTAAKQFYLCEAHHGAHSAAADARATAEILDAMVERYGIPRRVKELEMHYRGPEQVDAAGCFVKAREEICFAFGKYRGQPLTRIAEIRPKYLEWILTQAGFWEETKGIVRAALEKTGEDTAR